MNITVRNKLKTKHETTQHLLKNMQIQMALKEHILNKIQFFFTTIHEL